MAEIPDPATFFLEVPLYASCEIDSSNYEKALQIEGFNGTIDAFCAECESISVFQEISSLASAGRPFGLGHVITRKDLPSPEQMAAREQEAAQARLALAVKDRTFTKEFRCTRCKHYKLYFWSDVRNSILTKAGQYPSLADLHREEIKKYRQVLEDSGYRELSRAIGLSAHGVGIGAFVYLRRILERLVEDAHADATEGEGWDEDSYERARITEKIGMLQDHLPQFVVEHSHVYAILSKGIHELQEEECLEYFDVLRGSIELTLDQRIERQEREAKTEQTAKALGSISTKLGRT